MTLTVVAKIQTKTGSADTVHAELRKLIEPTCTKDAGCISYELYLDKNDPRLFFFLETWESEELLNRHLNSGYFKAYAKAIDGFAEKSELHILTKSD